MRTLCIDTSGPAAIALVDDRVDASGPILAGSDEGRVVLAEAIEPNARRHAESLGVLLQQVLEQAGATSMGDAGVERICVGVGPGPFTGLRAGLVFASTLGRGLGVDVLGVCSLEGLARIALDEAPTERVLVVTDAKRKEVYWGVYDANGTGDVTVLAGPSVGAPSDALGAAGKFGVTSVAGPAELLVSVSGDNPRSGDNPSIEGFRLIQCEVAPAVFARIVDARTAADGGAKFPLTPLYLRRPDIHGQPTEAM